MSEQDPPRFDGVTIVSHFNAVLAERDKAIEVAFIELQRRLDILNHAHDDMKDRDKSFYSREMHESFAAKIEEQFGQIRKDMLDAQKPNYWYAASAATLMVATMIGLWSLSQIITEIQFNQKHMIDQLDEHRTTEKKVR
jgi:hypothetical protein